MIAVAEKIKANWQKGIRKTIKDILFFEPGTLQDYIFNGWFENYLTYEEYFSFASAELKWLEQ